MLNKNKFYTGRMGVWLGVWWAGGGTVIELCVCVEGLRSFQPLRCVRTCVRTYALVIVFAARRRVTRALPRLAFIYVSPRGVRAG